MCSRCPEDCTGLPAASARPRAALPIGSVWPRRALAAAALAALPVLAATVSPSPAGASPAAARPATSGTTARHDAAPAAGASALRICADPDNPPYSQEHGAASPGFEVRIAQLLAAQMQVPLEVHWQPLLRGFVRKSLGAHACDALMGVPVGYGPVLSTRPYYRSSYVFVTRRDAAAPLASFDDPRLPSLRIGVPLIGDDLLASPPGVALTHRGVTAHVVGFTLLGGERPEGQRIVQAVARGELDAALAWGPQVGWFASHAQPAVALRIAERPADVKEPFQFGIAVGVRKHDTALRDRLQAALDAQHEAIDAVLRDYGVPRVDGERERADAHPASPSSTAPGKTQVFAAGTRGAVSAETGREARR